MIPFNLEYAIDVFPTISNGKYFQLCHRSNHTIGELKPLPINYESCQTRYSSIYTIAHCVVLVSALALKGLATPYLIEITDMEV